MKDFTADAESRLGVPAVKAEKTLCGNDIDIIGYTNDTTLKHTIGLSRPLFLKMVCAVYVMVASDFRPGDQILVHTLQSLASRAIRSADVVPVMASFSRSFSSCLKGVPVTATSAILSERAYEDLWMWRVALQLGFHDRNWLVLPIRIPLLLRYHHNEDAVGRMHRQAASADVVVYVDACTKHGNGMAKSHARTGPSLVQHQHCGSRETQDSAACELRSDHLVERPTPPSRRLRTPS